jgi:hypothetical protein
LAAIAFEEDFAAARAGVELFFVFFFSLFAILSSPFVSERILVCNSSSLGVPLEARPVPSAGALLRPDIL